MASHQRKEFLPIVDELKRQGWEVDLTASGHYKAKPPDRQKAIIHFSTSCVRRSVKNTIRDLRKSGFLWPPPEPPKSLVDDPDFDEWFNVDDEVDDERRRGGDGDEDERATLVVAPKEKTFDDLVAELRAARDDAVLYGEQVAECKRAVDVAQRALTDAEKEHETARRRLLEAKTAFDAVVNV
jgi:hypothetical protein